MVPTIRVWLLSLPHPAFQQAGNFEIREFLGSRFRLDYDTAPERPRPNAVACRREGGGG